MEIFSLIVNNAFYLSILLIVLSALIGVFVRMRSKDRCLKSFHEYPVTLEMTNGKKVFGKLHVFGSGIEIVYDKPHQDADGHPEYSFILYASEYAKMNAVYRFPDSLDDEQRADRDKEIRHAHYPSLRRIAFRRIRNFFNTFRDAIIQAISVFLGNVAQQNKAVAEKQKSISGLGEDIVGFVSHAYEPILERYIGDYVVLEYEGADGSIERYGILKEYTNLFIEVAGVLMEECLTETLDPQALTMKTDILMCEIQNDTLHIRNTTNQSKILVDRLAHGETSLIIDTLVPAGESIDIPVAQDLLFAPDTITIVFRIIHKADIISPRNLAVIRHGGERVKRRLTSLLGLRTPPLETHDTSD